MVYLVINDNLKMSYTINLLVKVLKPSVERRDMILRRAVPVEEHVAVTIIMEVGKLM